MYFVIYLYYLCMYLFLSGEAADLLLDHCHCFVHWLLCESGHPTLLLNRAYSYPPAAAAAAKLLSNTWKHSRDRVVQAARPLQHPGQSPVAAWSFALNFVSHVGDKMDPRSRTPPVAPQEASA